jgi:hypothetical protein
MAAAPTTVVETPFFLRKSASPLAESERSELIVFLGMNPDVGDVIPEAGGIVPLLIKTYAKGRQL